MKDETQFCQRKSLVRANSWGLASRHEGKAVSRRTTSFVVVLVVGTAALCSPAEAQQTFYRPPAVTSIRRLHKQNRQRNIAQKRQEPPPPYPPANPTHALSATRLTGKSCRSRRSPNPRGKGVAWSPSPPGSFRPPTNRPAERTSACRGGSQVPGTTASQPERRGKGINLAEGKHKDEA